MATFRPGQRVRIVRAGPICARLVGTEATVVEPLDCIEGGERMIALIRPDA